MKISVFIPSIPRSFGNLKNIVEVYNTGTLPPDEIIINASGVDTKELSDMLADVRDYKYGNITVYAQKLMVSAGANRALSGRLTTGDIIIYQDDDDLPSPHRVEVIKHYFQKYDIKALHHGIVANTILPRVGNVNYPKIREIPSNDLYERYFPFGKLDDVWQYSRWYGVEFNVTVGTGVISIRREVLDEVNWKDKHNITLCRKGDGTGEDYDFSMEVLHKFNNSMVIDIPLYSYKFVPKKTYGGYYA